MLVYDRNQTDIVNQSLNQLKINIFLRQPWKKKNEAMPCIATWMDLEIVILSEVSQTEKDEYHTVSFTCRI